MAAIVHAYDALRRILTRDATVRIQFGKQQQNKTSYKTGKPCMPEYTDMHV
jgi:hypothetical protein